MGTVGDDLLGAVGLEGGGGLAQGAGGVDHVVHDDAGTAVDFADDVHHFRDVGLRAALVDDRQVAFEALGQRAGADDAAVVRRDDQRVLVILLADVVEQDGQGVDVVDRNVEEALDLFGVQVHGQHAVDAGGDEHVGDQLGGDGHARGTRAAILAGVAEIRDGGGDAAGRGALEGVDHDQHFHQVVVGRGAGRLQHEDVATADMFLQLDGDFAIREAADIGATQIDVQLLCDVGGQLRVGVAGEDHQAVVGHFHIPPDSQHVHCICPPQ